MPITLPAPVVCTVPPALASNAAMSAYPTVSSSEHRRRLASRSRDRALVGARGELDLPIDRQALEGPARQLPRAHEDEGAESCDQSDRRGDAGCGAQQTSGPVQNKAPYPQRHHGLLLVSRRPSFMRQTLDMRVAIS